MPITLAIGDVVRIRSFESMREEYGTQLPYPNSIVGPGYHFVDGMRRGCGKVVTITGFIARTTTTDTPRVTFTSEEEERVSKLSSEFGWSPYMFEAVDTSTDVFDWIRNNRPRDKNPYTGV